MADSAATPRYENPPLVEAVVAFQFSAPASDWGAEVLDRLYNRVRTRLPRTSRLTGTSIQVTPDKGVGPISSAPEMRRFAREDGGMVVTAGADLLGVSILPRQWPGGHPGWSVLRDEALTALSIFRREVVASELRQIGVRYINALVVDPDTFRLGDMVSDESGIVPSALLEERNPCSLRVERTREVGEDFQRREVIALEAQPAGGNSGRLVLDVDELYLLRPGTEPNELQPVLDQLHQAIHYVFSTVVSARLRESFQPVVTPSPRNP